MATLEELFNNERVKEEYKRALHLNMFKKLVIKMNKDSVFKRKIRTLYLQSTNPEETTKVIFNKNFNYSLSSQDSQIVLSWVNAYLNKKSTRKHISTELKKELYANQCGKCPVCGEDLGNDFSKIHVDHIIPFVLVGDELKDNYQCLCDFCNECKSANIDYIFKQLINLN